MGTHIWAQQRARCSPTLSWTRIRNKIRCWHLFSSWAPFFKENAKETENGDGNTKMRSAARGRELRFQEYSSSKSNLTVPSCYCLKKKNFFSCWLVFSAVNVHYIYKHTNMDNVQNNKMFLKENSWASLVVQWLRIRLAVQGTLVQSLVREDPTCLGATKPMCPNYWSFGARTQQEKPPQWVAPAHHNERKPEYSNKDPAQPKN